MSADGGAEVSDFPGELERLVERASRDTPPGDLAKDIQWVAENLDRSVTKPEDATSERMSFRCVLVSITLSASFAQGTSKTVNDLLRQASAIRDGADEGA
jgi:hypothetical protein